MNRVLVFFAILFYSPTLEAQDWSAFRGDDGKGITAKQSLVESDGPIELKVRWKKKLGSGYSSVVAVEGHVVTSYCDGQHDYVICLDPANGDVKWQSVIGDKFKGENGSFDGPISTPLVYRNKVYALDPAGRLVCLALKNGEESWSKHLVDDYGAKRPLYGFATSPIAVNDTLILQTGVKGASLAGLNLDDGEVVWKSTSDSIDSQSPIVMDVEGTSVIVAAGGKYLSGVDAANGEKLFEFEHKGGNGTAMVPVALPGQTVVLTLDDAYSTAVSLKPLNQNQISVSQEWKERSIKNTYNVPVLCNGNLFAYSTRILTCVDPNTGKPQWKSRKPGDGFLIAVGDHVIINTKKGSLHVAEASNEEYTEVGKLQLFDDLVWSLPAYSRGAIYCRSLGEIACVEISDARSIVDAKPATGIQVGPLFQAMIDQVVAEASVERRQELVDEFVAKQDQFPIIEDEIVHFVYQGEAKDVAVAGDIFGARQEQTMAQIADTNLYYYSLQLPNDQRASYVYLVDYVPQVDPKNDRMTVSSVYAGEMEFAVRLKNEQPLKMSWFGMAGWEQPEYLSDSLSEIQSQRVDHKIDESGKSVDAVVYLPAGYQDSKQGYRTLYIFADPKHNSSGQLVPALEKIVAANEEIEPVILVFPQISAFGLNPKSLVDDLIPSVDAKYRTLKSANMRRTVGFGMMAGEALTSVFKHPEILGGTAVYSPMVFDAAIRQIDSAVDKLESPVDVYVEWGRFDMFNPHENWDVRDIAKKVLERCSGNEKITARGGQQNDSGDWSSWRNRYMEIFRGW